MLLVVDVLNIGTLRYGEQGLIFLWLLYSAVILIEMERESFVQLNFQQPISQPN